MLWGHAQENKIVLWRELGKHYRRSDIWPRSWRVKWNFQEKDRELSSPGFSRAALRRKKAVKMGNQNTLARGLWEVGSHEGNVQCVGRKRKEEASRRGGKEWEELQDMLLFDGLDQYLLFSKKKNLLSCLRDAPFCDKTIQSPSRPRVGEWILWRGWKQVTDQDTWGPRRWSVMFSFFDLSSSDEDVCYINNYLLLWVILVSFFFQFKKLPISGWKMGLIVQGLWMARGSVEAGGRPLGGSATPRGTQERTWCTRGAFQRSLWWRRSD